MKLKRKTVAGGTVGLAITAGCITLWVLYVIKSNEIKKAAIEDKKKIDKELTDLIPGIVFLTAGSVIFWVFIFPIGFL